MTTSDGDQGKHCWSCGSSLDGAESHACRKTGCKVCPKCGETLCSYTPEAKEAAKQAGAPRPQAVGRAGDSRKDKGEARVARPRIQPHEAYILRRLVVGHDVNGELDRLSGPFCRVADHLAGLPPELRQVALDGFLCDRSDGDEIVKALVEVDLEGPPPEAETAERCATLADVRRLVTEARWLWRWWLAAGVLNALAADPGTGKTILAFEIARCLWFRKDFPDGQPNEMPEGTRTLWVPGDRHYAQLIELGGTLGLPDEAILFNAPASDPTGGLDLDQPEELAALAERIDAEKPGLVIVDTVGMTTEKNLCRPQDARAYFGPLMDLAQQTGVPFLLLTHLSREAQALGRRIVGACRLVLKMTAHELEGQPEGRRLWVDKSYAEKPPPLGMTIADAGCSFAPNPPDPPGPNRGGRPREKRNKAQQFIRDALTHQNHRIGTELCAEWEAADGNYKTFWRAVEEMEAAGELTTEGGPGEGYQKVLHLNEAAPDPDHPGK
jgi:hypothetical protein